jgi:LEA14-like dessication related protein
MIKKPLYFVLLLLLSCCTNFEDIELGKPEDIRITGLKNNVLELEIKVPVKNPRSIGFKIKEIDIKTSVNNQYLGKLTTDKAIVIPAKSNEIHNFRLKLKIANVIQGIALVLEVINHENIKLQMEGYIKFKSLMVGRKINIEETLYINSFK